MSRLSAKPVETQLDVGHPFYAVIQDAYRVFASPRPVTVDVCTSCCMDPKIVADFFTRPVNQLPLRYLQDWYAAAYQPNGIQKTTWTYLLPRVLEGLAAGEELSYNGYEAVLKRFPTGNPGKWTTDQWEVLDRFQRMFLTAKIDRNAHSLDDLLCMFCRGGWALDALISQVRSLPIEQLVECLWGDWCKWPMPGRGDIWLTSFWEKPERETVFDFYTSQELYARIEAIALSDNVTPELAARASAVAGVIEANADWHSGR